MDTPPLSVFFFIVIVIIIIIIISFLYQDFNNQLLKKEQQIALIKINLTKKIGHLSETESLLKESQKSLTTAHATAAEKNGTIDDLNVSLTEYQNQLNVEKKINKEKLAKLENTQAQMMQLSKQINTLLEQERILGRTNSDLKIAKIAIETEKNRLTSIIGNTIELIKAIEKPQNTQIELPSCLETILTNKNRTMEQQRVTLNHFEEKLEKLNLQLAKGQQQIVCHREFDSILEEPQLKTTTKSEGVNFISTGLSNYKELTFDSFDEPTLFSKEEMETVAITDQLIDVKPILILADAFLFRATVSPIEPNPSDGFSNFIKSRYDLDTPCVGFSYYEDNPECSFYVHRCPSYTHADWNGSRPDKERYLTFDNGDVGYLDKIYFCGDAMVVSNVSRNATMCCYADPRDETQMYFFVSLPYDGREPKIQYLFAYEDAFTVKLQACSTYNMFRANNKRTVYQMTRFDLDFKRSNFACNLSRMDYQLFFWRAHQKQNLSISLSHDKTCFIDIDNYGIMDSEDPYDLSRLEKWKQKLPNLLFAQHGFIGIQADLIMNTTIDSIDYHKRVIGYVTNDMIAVNENLNAVEVSRLILKFGNGLNDTRINVEYYLYGLPYHSQEYRDMNTDLIRAMCSSAGAFKKMEMRLVRRETRQDINDISAHETMHVFIRTRADLSTYSDPRRNMVCIMNRMSLETFEFARRLPIVCSLDYDLIKIEPIFQHSHVNSFYYSPPIIQDAAYRATKNFVSVDPSKSEELLLICPFRDQLSKDKQLCLDVLLSSDISIGVDKNDKEGIREVAGNDGEIYVTDRHMVFPVKGYKIIKHRKNIPPQWFRCRFTHGNELRGQTFRAFPLKERKVKMSKNNHYNFRGQEVPPTPFQYFYPRGTYMDEDSYNAMVNHYLVMSENGEKLHSTFEITNYIDVHGKLRSVDKVKIKILRNSKIIALVESNYINNQKIRFVSLPEFLYRGIVHNQKFSGTIDITQITP